MVISKRKGNKTNENPNAINAEAISNFYYNLTKRISKDKNLPMSEIYSPEIAKYVAPYVRHISGKKTLSDEKAIELLNQDFVKDVQSGFIPFAKKQRSLGQAYSTFVNVCASARTIIGEKYGKNYYELEKSSNAQARAECEAFEKWVAEKEKIFADYDKATILAPDTPNALMEQSMLLVAYGTILATAGIGGVLGREDVGFFGGAIVGAMLGAFFVAPAVVIALDGPDSRDLSMYADKIANDFGFKDEQDMINYLQEYLQVMPQAEKAELINSIVNNAKLSIAMENGFDSIEEAQRVAQSMAQESTMTLNQALQAQVDRYDYAKDYLAHKYGQPDFETMVTYLNNHKILVGHTTRHAGWSEYDYDSPNAQALANELSALDNFQAIKIQEIKNATWPQTITTYGQYTDMMNDMQATELVKETFYEKMLSSPDYAYGTDNVANAAYSDLVSKVGVEDVNNYADIPHSHNLEDLADNVMEAATQLDTSIVGMGALSGGVLGGLVRSIPMMSYGRKKHKIDASIEFNEKIEKQKQQDYESSNKEV